MIQGVYGYPRTPFTLFVPLCKVYKTAGMYIRKNWLASCTAEIDLLSIHLLY